MNQKNIAKKLNILKQIEPSGAFVSRGRLLLSFQPQKPAGKKIFALPWLAFTGAMAVVLLGANILLNMTIAQPRLALFFSQNDLRQEFAKLAMGLQLPEISYQQNVDAAIVLALNEISDAQPNHLNPVLLQKEKKELESKNGAAPGQEIDALLQTIIVE